MSLAAKCKTPLLLLFSLSLLLFAQPDWSRAACILAACLSWALFWQALASISSRPKRFWCALLLFATIQCVHLNWFFSDQYVGPYIYIFLLFWALATGLFFATYSELLFTCKRLNLPMLIGLAGLWALFEWGKLFFLCGFTWNPIGLSLSATLPGTQAATLQGVFGLNFFVILTNLFAWKFLQKGSKRNLISWLLFALLPYGFGFCHLAFHQKAMRENPSESLSLLLVQNSLYPEQKLSFANSNPLTPLQQWQHLLSLLHPHLSHPVDLIVFPEAVVPYGAHIPIYTKESIMQTLTPFLQPNHSLPEIETLFCGNSAWAQSLANLFHADLIIGLEDFEKDEAGALKAYNAAFCFPASNTPPSRYEKQILLPIAEYIPFDWCKKFAARYGIYDSYTRGKRGLPLQGTHASYGVTICYEETFSALVRKLSAGAALLINLSNDVWYPHSRLPLIHFQHGRLRAVELGMPLVRSCNTGVTCAINSLGGIIEMADYETQNRAAPATVLSLTLPLYGYQTLYKFSGELPLLILSLLGALYFICNFFYLNALKNFRLQKNAK
jgi:apolipoprotein N-acyltransferase